VRTRARPGGRETTLLSVPQGNDEVGDAGIEPLDDENVDDEGPRWNMGLAGRRSRLRRAVGP